MTTTRRFDHRDSKGRFAKRHHRCTVAVWHTTGDDVSHSHADCPEMAGGVVTEERASGWLCVTCVLVTTDRVRFAEATAHLMVEADVAGAKECECCRVTLNVSRFPTMTVAGFKTRGGTCRTCRDADETAA